MTKVTTKKETLPKEKSLAVSIKQEPTTVNVQTLLTQAIDKNIPVETMERLLAMAEKMQAIQAKREFDHAMAKFQSEIETIEKRKKVSFNTTSYSYAPLEDIVEQVKDALARNGFSYTFDTIEADKAIKVICYAKHIAGHTEPSSLTIEIDQASKMNKTQQYGSANSYGKRYAFCNAFGILTGDEDNDVQTPSQPKKTYSKPVKPTPELSELGKDYKKKLEECKNIEDFTKIRENLNFSKNTKKLTPYDIVTLKPIFDKAEKEILPIE